MAGKKILVADDSLTIQKVIRLALSGDGYEIQTVSDGREAIEQASLFRPDICIIDVSLPQFDAYQVREQFLGKPDLQNVPVILMSSAFEKVDETRAKNLGFAGHLIKPFDPSHLRSTLLSVANLVTQNDLITTTINAPIQPQGAIKFEPPNMTATDLPPLSSDVAYVDDIQQMSKSTFELSGMSQHEWGMFEPGKVGATQETQPSANEVVSIDFNSIPHTSGYSHETQHQFSVSPQELETMIQNQVSKVMEQMQSQIKDRIEKELLQFSQATLPTMAEKIIKSEISKLLSEPPL